MILQKTPMDDDAQLHQHWSDFADNGREATFAAG
jgi:hypothetical protein